MSILKEFKAFALRGNVVDLAVAIAVGTAFTRIVTSLVNDIIMPPIGLLIGGVDFSNLKVVLKQGAVDETGKVVGEVAIAYGAFINTIISFLIIAAAVFLLVKLIYMLQPKPEPAPAGPSLQEQQTGLLTEIRDLLSRKA